MRELHPALAALKNAFIHMASLEALLARATQLESQPASSRGPLWGVPFATKDNVDVAGMPTTAACPAFSYTPAQSAPAVQALLDAGEACPPAASEGIRTCHQLSSHRYVFFFCRQKQLRLLLTVRIQHHLCLCDG